MTAVATGTTPDVAGGVRVEGISKSFGWNGSRVTVLDGIDLNIGMREFV